MLGAGVVVLSWAGFEVVVGFEVGAVITVGFLCRIFYHVPR